MNFHFCRHEKIVCLAKKCKHLQVSRCSLPLTTCPLDPNVISNLFVLLSLHVPAVPCSHYSTHLGFAKSSRALDRHVFLVQSSSPCLAPFVAESSYFYQRHVSLHFAQFLFNSFLLYFCFLPTTISFFLRFYFSLFFRLKNTLDHDPRVSAHQQTRKQHTDGTGCLILNPISFPSSPLSRPLVIYRAGDFLLLHFFVSFLSTLQRVVKEVLTE